MANFLQFLLESAVCLALFYGFYWLLLKDETFFVLNRAYLVASLVFSFVIPLAKVTSPVFTRQVASLTLGSMPPPPETGFVLSLSLVLGMVYVLGVLALSVRFARQLARITNTIRTSPTQSCRDCRYVFIDVEIQPFSFFGYIFLNRKNISPHDLTRILAHERIHIKQRHSMDSILMELVTILQWFNPFVWPYKKSLKETHEYLADNAVIAQGCSAAGYQLLILEQHVGGKLVELAHNFNHSQIKRRITMMSRIKSKGTAKLKLLLILPLAAFLVLVLAEPKLVAQAERADGDAFSASLALPAPDHSAVPQDKSEKQKKEEKLKQQQEQEKKTEEVMKEAQIIQAKIAEVEVAIKKTDDPKQQQELKATLMKLYDKDKKIKTYLNGENGNGEMKKVEYLEVTPEMVDDKIKGISMKLKQTDDPKEQKELETQLKELYQMKKALENGEEKYVKVASEKGKKEKEKKEIK
ncbi:MAG: M56 family metallopeptidase [Candidatus Aminicenantaceae bacterium]